MNREMNVVYLHGFASSPQSTKARYFEARFEEQGIAMETPDLAAGDFENLTISGQLAVVQAACRGRKVVLMGSSMGGYLAALYAVRHPAEVERVVLLAPAFRLARRWAEVFGPERFGEWERTGVMPVFHYGEGQVRNLGFRLIEDGRGYEDYPEFTQPGLILHGTGDAVVPVELSRTFAAQRPNITVKTYAAGHELTEVLEPMWKETWEFLQGQPSFGRP